MPTRSFENTRRFRRRTVRILVDYVSDQGVRCDYATTLGAGGLFIESDTPLPSGCVLKMRFRLPESALLHEIQGRVSWLRSDGAPGGGPRAPGMGIQFTDSEAAARLARELEDLP
jgi:uncharacterized protein (TIGR02266 family)